MITLFGATGYTGRKIAAVLAREELPFRIAGRSPERLRALSAALSASPGGAPEYIVADAQRAETLAPLFAGTRLLINCAGPYTDLGERVLAQAAVSGVHYLDMTNELGYRYRVRSYHELARKTGAALVPACGFEVALADCAAAVIATAISNLNRPLDALEVLYVLTGTGASTGTRRSAVRALATSWIAYRDSGWVGSVPGGKVRAFDLAGKKRHALEFPSCEIVTVPAHLPVQAVSVWMSSPPGARFWAPVLVPIFARLARSILGPLFVRLAGGRAIKEGDQRRVDRFQIYVIARRGDECHRLRLAGSGVYNLTAEIIGYYARAMLQADYSRTGLLAPAQAVDPAAFLDWTEQQGYLSRQMNP